MGSEPNERYFLENVSLLQPCHLIMERVRYAPLPHLTPLPHWKEGGVKRKKGELNHLLCMKCQVKFRAYSFISIKRRYEI